MAHLARACVAASTPCSSAPPEQSPRRTCKAVRRAELNIQRSCAHWRSYLCHRVPGNLKFCFSRFHRMIQLMFTDKFTSRNAVHRMWRTTPVRAVARPLAPPGTRALPVRRGPRPRRGGRAGSADRKICVGPAVLPPPVKTQKPKPPAPQQRTPGRHRSPPCCVHRMLQRLLPSI